MITQSKFEAGLRLLQEHYNKTLSENAICIWREYLDAELDDEEFVSAVKESILTCEFFPTPKKLVEMATKSLEVKAIEEWQTVVKWSAYAPEHQQTILASFSPRCRMALQVVGGFNAVGYAESYALTKLEKNFTAAYCQCSPSSKALPPAQAPAKVYEPEEEAPKTFDITKAPAPIRKVIEVWGMRSAGEELSERQSALNMFALRWNWQIDESRLEHYLAIENKQQFLSKFLYAMRHSPSWKHACTHFDCITGYRAIAPENDSKAIAQQWLQSHDNN